MTWPANLALDRPRERPPTRKNTRNYTDPPKKSNRANTLYTHGQGFVDEIPDFAKVANRRLDRALQTTPKMDRS